MYTRHLRICFLICVALALGLTTVLAGSATATLPRGAELEVRIDTPETSWEYLIPAGETTRDVTVAGGASLGRGEPGAKLVYVIDVSGSTAVGGGTGCGPILDCEKKFVKQLNDAAIASGSVNEVGVAVYSYSAAAADMKAEDGEQLIIAPDYEEIEGTRNLNVVVDSAYANTVGTDLGCGVKQYTAYDVTIPGRYTTNFAAGLRSAKKIVDASTNDINIIIFLSDGVSNEGGGDFNDALTALAQPDTVAYTFAVGTGSSCTGGSAGTLQQIADDTGGTCYTVLDPGDLPDLIPDLISTWLDKLEIAVDGGTAIQISNDDIDPDLPQDGPIGVSYNTTVAGLKVGDREICVTASAHDTAENEPTTTATMCETIHLFKLMVNPENATNELGTPGQEHTIIATLLGDHKIADRTIDFAITAGPNAGVGGFGQTDASGQVAFTYEAMQGCEGLGIDKIEATITLNDPLGETGTATAEKLWEDTTAPVVTCDETANPAGKTVPPPKNQDGFFVLLAEDAVDPDPMIYLVDTGSGTVFGPFASGTTVKYTVDSMATPEQKLMGARGRGQATHIDWHIIGQGEAQIYAVDCAGNATDPWVPCVLRPPKP